MVPSSLFRCEIDVIFNAMLDNSTEDDFKNFSNGAIKSLGTRILLPETINWGTGFDAQGVDNQ